MTTLLSIVLLIIRTVGTDEPSVSQTIGTRALNIGLIAACFGILVSLSDFFLKPAQKVRIEQFIDSLTLRLDYTKTLDWLQRWLKASRHASITSIAFMVINVVIALWVLIVVLSASRNEAPWWGRIGIGILTCCICLLLGAYIFSAYKHVGVPIVDWLAESASYRALIGRYAGVIFGGALALIVCILILAAVAVWLSTFPKVWLALSGGFVVGLLLCWIGVIIDGIVTILGALIVFFMRTFVDTSRWLMCESPAIQKVL